MTRALHFEWAKWIRERGVRVVVVVVILGSAGCGLVLGMLARLDAVSEIVAVLTRTGPTGYEVAFATLRTVMSLLVLIGLLWSSASLANEVERGTIRASLLRLPRRTIPLAKLAVIAATLLALSVLVALVSFAMGGQAFGLASVSAGSIEIHSQAALVRAGFTAMALSWLPLITWCSLAICVSSLARSSQSALASVLGVSLLLGGLTLVPGLGSFLFPNTWWWSFDVATSKAEGLRTLSFADHLPRHLAVNLLWTALFLGVGTRHFVRKDLSA